MDEPVARCELCQAKKITHWHYEDERLWIADCAICDVPMVVLKKHGLGTEEDLQYMTGVAKQLFGDKCEIDLTMRLIPDHRHFHVRWWTRNPASSG